MLRGDAERESRVASTVAVRPFGDADESLLAGGYMYTLEKPDPILVRLKVEHSGFGTLNNQRVGSEFFEEVANPCDSELRWMTQSYSSPFREN